MARLDLERAVGLDDPVALAERAVIVFAICAPVFELLRRLAQEDQVRRRVAGGTGLGGRQAHDAHDGCDPLDPRDGTPL